MQEIKALYGFDKPPVERFLSMLKGFAKFDLGQSFYHHKDVWELVKSKLPVSITIGLWTFFLTYVISVPLGVAFDSQPNLSSTIWTTVFDHKKSVMYFDSQTSPNTFWVDFKELDFSEGAPVKKLTVAGGMIYAGDTAKQFEASNPIAFFAVPA